MDGATPTWTSMSGDVTVSATGVTTVGKIQGVVISGTPSNGQILIATSSSAADWQNAPSGSFVRVLGEIYQEHLPIKQLLVCRLCQFLRHHL